MLDRKGSRVKRTYPGRQKKRRFCGNRYVTVCNTIFTSTKKTSKMVDDEKKDNSSEFNFKEKCFICGEICSPEVEIKKRYSKRHIIYKVCGHSKMLERIRLAAEAKEDDLSKKIKDRLHEGVDLVAKNAVYHGHCLCNFLSRTPKRHEKDQEKSVDKENAATFDEVCFEMENSDDLKFSLECLYKKMSDDAQTMESLKTMLQQRYGNEISISSLESAETVVFMKKPFLKKKDNEKANDASFGTNDLNYNINLN